MYPADALNKFHCIFLMHNPTGTRLLNMSDFRDHTKSGSWDYSAYVRTYALYLDEQLEFHMHNRRRRKGSLGGEDDDEEGHILVRKKSSPIPTTPVRDMRTDHIFTRVQHLQQLLERFLACRPTGENILLVIFHYRAHLIT